MSIFPALDELALNCPFRLISPKCFIDGGTKNGVKGYVGIPSVKKINGYSRADIEK